MLKTTKHWGKKSKEPNGETYCVPRSENSILMSIPFDLIK